MGGRVVEHAVVRLRHGLRLGDAPDARVAFPGPCLEVARDKRGWTLGGHRLVPGRSLALSLERCAVRVHLVEADPIPRALDDLPDPRLMVAMAALVLMVASIDVGARTVDAHPKVAQALQAYVVGTAEAKVEDEAPAVDVGPDYRWRPPVGFHARPSDAGEGSGR